MDGPDPTALSLIVSDCLWVGALSCLCPSLLGAGALEKGRYPAAPCPAGLPWDHRDHLLQQTREDFR